MKNLFFAAAFMLVGSVSFASTGITATKLANGSTLKKADLLRERTMVVYCNGVRSGYITCACTDAQFNSMANTICNP